VTAVVVERKRCRTAVWGRRAATHTWGGDGWGEGEISTGKGGEQRVSSCREVGV
jgi:hypothetical protein